MLPPAYELLGQFEVSFAFPLAPRLYDLLETGRRVRAEPGVYAVRFAFPLLASLADGDFGGWCHSLEHLGTAVGWIWSADLYDLRSPTGFDTIDESAETSELPQRLVSPVDREHLSIDSKTVAHAPLLGWPSLSALLDGQNRPEEHGSGATLVCDVGLRTMNPATAAALEGDPLPREEVLYHVRSAVGRYCWTYGFLLRAAERAEEPSILLARFWPE